MHRVFRFDDICVNANIQHANSIAALLCNKFDDAEIWYCVSPLCFDMPAMTSSPVDSQRIFPRQLNAMSDPTVFYHVNKCDTMKHVVFPEHVTIASHGLIHVDHRLLDHGAQEMSIVASCSLLDARFFVPPFNKWNLQTELICEKHDIALVKFERGWRCMEYEPYEQKQALWYLHARELTLEHVAEWLKGI